MPSKRDFPGLSPSKTNDPSYVAALHVPLEAVRVFEAAARLLGFSAAAEELGVTQSAVSQRVKGLEAALGVALFRRLPQGLRLTEAGQSYLLDVRPALQRLRAATGRAAVQGARRTGMAERVLAVGTTNSIALLCLAPHLSGFQKAFPGVALRIETNITTVDPAEAGLDCCLRYGAGQWPGVTAERLAGEDLFPICAPALVNADLPSLRVRDLCNLPLVHDLGPVSWVEWLARFGAPSPRQSESVVVTDSALAQQAAMNGIGVALGRSQLADRALKAGQLIRPVAQSLPSPFGYFMVRPHGRNDEKLVSSFKDWLVATVFLSD
jgi:LysR family glycine cleavage system transcriptional activator